jgi:hypothetical protein
LFREQYLDAVAIINAHEATGLDIVTACKKLHVSTTGTGQRTTDAA